MARKVFYSFHYANDINRVMVVRNRWVTKEDEANRIIDAAEFEEIKLKGDNAVKQWIDEQLKGTSVTVVLIGKETLKRKFVKYEICQSLNKGNAILGVFINNIKDMKTGSICDSCSLHTQIGQRNGVPVYFDEICDDIYDYQLEDGYNSLGRWVEDTFRKHNKR